MATKRLNIRPRLLLSIFSLVFVAMQIVLCYDKEVLTEDVAGILIITLVFLLLIWLTSRGSNIARWITSIFFTIYALPITFAGIAIPSISISILGVVSVIIGLSLHAPVIKNLSLQSQQSFQPEYNFEVALPDLVDRFKSSIIDNILMISLVAITIYAFDHLNVDPIWTRLTCISILLTYEPLLVCYSCTLGQAISKIRVRSINSTDERIGIFNSYLRYLTKIVFGLFSFILINFNSKKRAIHDYTGSSIVVKK